MGARIETAGEYIVARSDRLRGIEYSFPKKTVTGTENLLMAATLAEGTSVLRNCALEPEIGDLVELLLKMGAEIRGKDTEILEITGQRSLAGANHAVIPDRIEAGTFIIAGSFSGNSLRVEGANPLHLTSLLDILRGMGVGIDLDGDSISIRPAERLLPADIITAPYPGWCFPGPRNHFQRPIQACLRTEPARGRNRSPRRFRPDPGQNGAYRGDPHDHGSAGIGRTGPGRTDRRRPDHYPEFLPVVPRVRKHAPEVAKTGSRGYN